MTIASQIQWQLQQPEGLNHETLEPLAIEYAQRVGQVNLRLAECVGLLRKGLRSEAIQRASMKPNVLDQSAELDFWELDEWFEILRFCGITLPPLVDRDAAAELHDAFLKEQPIEELLRQHRRLALGKAPLGWRLSVLRSIRHRDSLNPVWDEDIRQWETVRIQQIRAAWRDADEHGDLTHLNEFHKELSYPTWLVTPPVELKQQVDQARQRHLKREQIESLKSMADSLHQAYVEGNEATAISLATDWDAMCNQMRSPAPSDLLNEIAPALDWVQEVLRNRALNAEKSKLESNLSLLLNKETSHEEELKRAYRDVIDLELGIDFELLQRYQNRINQIHSNRRRKYILTISGISALVFGSIASVGYWFWNESYQNALTKVSSQLTKFLDEGKIEQAKQLLDEFEKKAPYVARAPQMQKIATSISAKLVEETKRRDAFINLLATTEGVATENLDPSTIVAAEKLASSSSEREEVAILRARMEQHQRLQTDKEFESLRDKLSPINDRIQKLLKGPVDGVTDTELEAIKSDLKNAVNAYPKGAAKASKLVDTITNRVGALQEEIVSQRRNMKEKERLLQEIKTATTTAELETGLKSFIEALPRDAFTKDFLTVLAESPGWKRMDDWIFCCNQFTKQHAAGLLPQDLPELLKQMNSVRSSLDGLPTALLVERFAKAAELAQNRADIIKTLQEDLNESVLIELYTLQTNRRNRVFLNHESFENYADAIKKSVASTKMNLPIISGADGTISNKDFRGQLEYTEEPRASVRILTRTLQSKQDEILADWENKMIGLMRQIIEDGKLDSQIKEMLFARLVSAAREGSISIRESFTGVQDALFPRADARGKWFLENPINFDFDATVKNAFDKACQDALSRKEKENVDFTSLSKSRVVWVGVILKGSSNDMVASLYRSDVPDGQLYTLLGVPGRNENWRLVMVGSVRNQEGQLDRSIGNQLPGRPLYWMRAPSSQQSTK